MRIVVDFQEVGSHFRNDFQKNDYNLLPLLKAISLHRGEHKVIFVLNSLSDFTAKRIRRSLKEVLPPENIKVWNPPFFKEKCSSWNNWHERVNDHIRNAFFSNLRPDIILIPHLALGYKNFAEIEGTRLFLAQRTVVIIDESFFNFTSFEFAESGMKLPNDVKCLQNAGILLVQAPLDSRYISKELNIPHHRVKDIRLDRDLYSGESLHAIAADIFGVFQTHIHYLNATPQDSTRYLLKLAYVSPLPPAKSGIADYSAELLEELQKFYDIEIVTDKVEIRIQDQYDGKFPIRSVDWLVQNSDQYDRVIYHFGNSSFHKHMFALLNKVPGVVVLHDFYLGDIQYLLEKHSIIPNAWMKSLYQGHGYSAVIQCKKNNNFVDAVRRFPANFDVLSDALGIIVHSPHCVTLAKQWYGDRYADDWAVIPLLRTPQIKNDRSSARSKLGLFDGHFIVCSFGLLGPNKLNHRVLESWLVSNLSKNAGCVLIFVGEVGEVEYEEKLRSYIEVHGLNCNVLITGWTDIEIYKCYLEAADIAVQLRTQSRGETSAAVLDTMNFSLPTIVNAHGSMAELPDNAVWMLPDQFTNANLVEALEVLFQNDNRRLFLSQRARNFVHTDHAPNACALQYAQAIEKFYLINLSSTDNLIKDIAKVPNYFPTDSENLSIAHSISESIPVGMPWKQLLVDVSATYRNDLKTGIQRVVRSLVSELILSPPQGYRVEPIYLTDDFGQWHYCYARDWTFSSLGVDELYESNEPVDFSRGDVILVADFTAGYVVEAEKAAMFGKFKKDGVLVHFIVYDLLPIQMPHVFPQGSFGFTDWISAVVRVADSVICISQAVANELKLWIQNSSNLPRLELPIKWFHLGADIESSIPSRGISVESYQTLEKIASVPSFLMVGTLEPRKGHLQAIDAFSLLWRQGININLVIVGKEGWKGLPDKSGYTIPEVARTLRSHAELGKKLLWLTNVSDEFLEKIYGVNTCLIAASEGEGFGLPLIEAAQHRLPIIARDLPVFREVAGEYAYYFEGKSADELAHCIKLWLDLRANNEIPRSDDMPWLTWAESAQQLCNAVFSKNFI